MEPPINNTPRYQIFIRDKESNILGEITQYQNLKFSDKHNNWGQCTFQLPSISEELAELVALRRYETLVYRNGDIVWSGEQATRFGTLRANDPELITVTSYTFLEMLAHRTTIAYVRYDNTDQGLILKDLVDDSQDLTDGDLGFTFASITATMSRDREYYRYKISDAFINMSNNINGIDFYITHDKVIHIVEFRGIDQSTQTIFEFGVNILEAEITEDFSTPSNQAFVLGSGLGSEQVEGSYIDTDARSVYKLRQQTISEIDVSSTDNLDDKAEAYVRKYKNSLDTISFTQIPNSQPQFGTISIGDSIRIKINKGIYNINNIYRVYGYEVQVGQNGEEYISYLVSLI